MEERIRCKHCGHRFRAENIDAALEAEELVCPQCDYLFQKGDLGTRDWLHRPIDEHKLKCAILLLLVVGGVVINAPIVALAIALTAVTGAVIALLIRAVRRTDDTLSIIDRKRPE